jgi:hypothetical protein
VGGGLRYKELEHIMSILGTTLPVSAQAQQTEQSNRPSQPPGADTQSTTASTGPSTVTPAQGSGTQKGAGSSTSYAGTGAGAGSQQPLNASDKEATPQRAEPEALFTARTSDATEADEPTQAEARAAAVEMMDRQRTVSWTEALNQTEQEENALPKPPLQDMPDPLPTSPFLKPAVKSV